MVLTAEHRETDIDLQETFKRNKLIFWVTIIQSCGNDALFMSRGSNFGEYKITRPLGEVHILPKLSDQMVTAINRHGSLKGARFGGLRVEQSKNKTVIYLLGKQENKRSGTHYRRSRH